MPKKNIVVIHQPDFLPYPGFFHRLLQADVFIILDHVPLSKSGWVHRDKIKTANGAEWITVPIKDIGSQPAVNTAEIDYNHHFGKIERLIKAHYAQAPYFSAIFPPLQEALSQRHQRLVDLNLGLLELLMAWFDIPAVRKQRSSGLGITAKKSRMNAALVKAVGGEIYLSGSGARDYHEDEPFDEAGISVIWQEFSHPVYPQLFGEFVPYLSSIDLLFNCGIQKSRALIRSC